MITETGKFLRKLRIDNDETLEDMATKLTITKSYLSQMETGKRRIPSHLLGMIKEKYVITQTNSRDLIIAHITDSSTKQQKEVLLVALESLLTDTTSNYAKALWEIIRLTIGKEIYDTSRITLLGWKEIYKAIKKVNKTT